MTYQCDSLLLVCYLLVFDETLFRTILTSIFFFHCFFLSPLTLTLSLIFHPHSYVVWCVCVKVCGHSECLYADLDSALDDWLDELRAKRRRKMEKKGKRGEHGQLDAAEQEEAVDEEEWFPGDLLKDDTKNPFAQQLMSIYCALAAQRVVEESMKENMFLSVHNCSFVSLFFLLNGIRCGIDLMVESVWREDKFAHLLEHKSIKLLKHQIDTSIHSSTRTNSN